MSEGALWSAGPTSVALHTTLRGFVLASISDTTSFACVIGKHRDSYVSSMILPCQYNPMQAGIQGPLLGTAL